jgi:large subunit ribosomal protein L6
MSRIANNPVALPKGVTVTTADNTITVKGSKGSLSLPLKNGIQVVQEGEELAVKADKSIEGIIAHAGATRAHLANMVRGVTEGYQKKLELVGVGYRAAVQGKNLNLTLGFSHAIAHPIPEGLTIECPTQTEVLIKGLDRQRVGQTAAEIRNYRPPEPYKGKGVRYSDEKIELKEAKKK